ncbi:hypothetical protein FRB96_009121 [Tulasnella sp. 330]|nr:hypothetical protein FRB96_009121 [Tulasnella sp. 330]
MPPKRAKKNNLKGKGKGNGPAAAKDTIVDTPGDGEEEAGPIEIPAQAPPPDIADYEPKGPIDWRDFSEVLVARLETHKDIKDALTVGGDLSLEPPTSEGDTTASYAQLADLLFKHHPNFMDAFELDPSTNIELGNIIRQRVQRLVAITKSESASLGDAAQDLPDEKALKALGNEELTDKWETIKKTNPWFFQIRSLLSSPAPVKPPTPDPIQQSHVDEGHVKPETQTTHVDTSAEVHTNHNLESTDATLVEHVKPDKAASPLVQAKELHGHVERPVTPTPDEELAVEAKGKKGKKDKKKGGKAGNGSPDDHESQQAPTPAAVAAEQLDPWGDSPAETTPAPEEHAPVMPKSPLVVHAPLAEVPAEHGNGHDHGHVNPDSQQHVEASASHEEPVKRTPSPASAPVLLHPTGKKLPKGKKGVAIGGFDWGDNNPTAENVAAAPAPDLEPIDRAKSPKVEPAAMLQSSRPGHERDTPLFGGSRGSSVFRQETHRPLPSPTPGPTTSLFSPPSMFNQLTAAVGQQAKVVKKSGWGGLFGGWGDSQPEEPVYQPPPVRESLFDRNRGRAERTPMPVSPQAGHQRGVSSFGGSAGMASGMNIGHQREQPLQPLSPTTQAPLADRKSAQIERHLVSMSPRADHQKDLPGLEDSGAAFSGMDHLDPSSAATGYHPHSHQTHAAPHPKAETNELSGLDMGQAGGGLLPNPDERKSQSRAGSVAAALRSRPPSAAAIARSRAASPVPPPVVRSREPSPSPAVERHPASPSQAPSPILAPAVELPAVVGDAPEAIGKKGKGKGAKLDSATLETEAEQPAPEPVQSDPSTTLMGEVTQQHQDTHAPETIAEARLRPLSRVPSPSPRSRAPSPAPASHSRAPSPALIQRARTPSPAPRALTPPPTQPALAEGPSVQPGSGQKGKRGKKGGKKTGLGAVESNSTPTVLNPLDDAGNTLAMAEPVLFEETGGSQVVVEPVRSRPLSRVPSLAPRSRTPSPAPASRSRAPSPALIQRARTPSPAPRALTPPPTQPALVEEPSVQPGNGRKGKKGKKGGKNTGLGAVESNSTPTVLNPLDDTGNTLAMAEPVLSEETGGSQVVVEPVRSRPLSRVPSLAPRSRTPSPAPASRSRAPSPALIQRARTPSPAPRALTPPPTQPALVEEPSVQTGNGQKGKKGKKGGRKMSLGADEQDPTPTSSSPQGDELGEPGAGPATSEDVRGTPLAVEPARSRAPSRAASPVLQEPSPGHIVQPTSPSPAAPPRAPSPVVEELSVPTGKNGKGKKGKKGTKNVPSAPAPDPSSMAPEEISEAKAKDAPGTTATTTTEEAIEGPLMDAVRLEAPSRVSSPAPREPSPAPIHRARSPSPTPPPKIPPPALPPVTEEASTSAGKNAKGKKGKKGVKTIMSALEPDPMPVPTEDPSSTMIEEVPAATSMVEEVVGDPMHELPRSRAPSRAVSPAPREPSLAAVLRPRSPSPAPPAQVPSPIVMPIPQKVVEEPTSLTGRNVKGKKGKKGAKNVLNIPDPEPVSTLEPISAPMDPLVTTTEDATAVTFVPDEVVEAPVIERVRSRPPSGVPSPAPREPSPTPILRARSPSPVPQPRVPSPALAPPVLEDTRGQNTAKNQKGKKGKKGAKMSISAIEPEPALVKTDVVTMSTPGVDREPEATAVFETSDHHIASTPNGVDLINEHPIGSSAYDHNMLVDTTVEPAAEPLEAVNEEPPMRMPSPRPTSSVLVPDDPTSFERRPKGKKGKDRASRLSVSFADEDMASKVGFGRDAQEATATPIVSATAIPEARNSWSTWQGEENPKSSRNPSDGHTTNGVSDQSNIAIPVPETPSSRRFPRTSQPAVVETSNMEPSVAPETSGSIRRRSGSKDLGAAKQPVDVMLTGRQDATRISSGRDQQTAETPIRSSAIRTPIPDPIISVPPLDMMPIVQGSKDKPSLRSAVDMSELPRQTSSSIRVPSASMPNTPNTPTYVSRATSPLPIKNGAGSSRGKRPAPVEPDSSPSSSSSSSPIGETLQLSSTAARRGLTMKQLITNISARPTSNAGAVRGSVASSPTEADRRRSIMTVATKGTAAAVRARPPPPSRRVSADAEKVVHCACCTVGGGSSHTALIPQRPSALSRRHSAQPSQGLSAVATPKTAIGSRFSMNPASPRRPMPIRRLSEQARPLPSPNAYAAQGRTLVAAPLPKEAPHKNNETFLQSAGKAFHGMKFRQVSVVEEDGSDDGRWTVNIVNEP